MQESEDTIADLVQKRIQTAHIVRVRAAHFVLFANIRDRFCYSFFPGVLFGQRRGS